MLDIGIIKIYILGNHAMKAFMTKTNITLNCNALKVTGRIIDS